MNRNTDLKTATVSQIQTNLARLKIISNKFINNLKKGENFELRTELNSEYRERRKEAVRRVIANMTIGKDVSGLFTDVLKNMQTDDLEIKKLIYLYLMSYAKVKPDLVILAVNTFVKDSEDKNPLLRALAIRTMGCLQVVEILDYIIDPLRRCLYDKDAYVRKTSAVCTAKVYELSEEAAIEYGLIDAVKSMVADKNTLVVANAVASLREMNEIAKNRNNSDLVWILDETTVTHMLSIINECFEWGQIAILEALVDYTPSSEKSAIYICKSVFPRLQHANCSVVLTSIRLLLTYQKFITNSEILEQVNKKIVPSLISLLSSAPEIQYAVLRSISLVLQQHPNLLSKQIRMFFLKYNDPEYIKFEKIELLVHLCDETSLEALLSELSEYSKEIDPSVSRRSIRAIERIAMRFKDHAERCLDAIIDLIALKNVETIQESAISVSRLSRSFQDLANGKISSSIIPTLCENYTLLESDPNAKASLITMAGECANVSPQIVFDLFSELEPQFLNEEESVQLAIVHASVIFFLRNPELSQTLVLRIIEKATEKCPNMDVRDVACMYWRLLSGDPNSAKQVVLSQKPRILTDSAKLSNTLLADFMNHLGCVSSILQLPPSKFLKSAESWNKSLTNTNQDLNSIDDQKSSANNEEYLANHSSKFSNKFDGDNLDEEPELLISL
ncbi:hypothetical protein BB561_003879 [Smittium simulii]|uniref:AP complex subunit beta n=1 Tax=Smittium simulii TaxID=133385 RepID=A0A2T9YJ53_9FUNG|nr:hypothetical protein BB561_003879 [Smittium simulii]